MDLNNITDYSNIKKFSLNNIICNAKIIKVYDGDSITAIFEYKNELYKWNCRLTGIDTPEIKTKDENEKKIAIIARDALNDKIINKIVKLHCYDFDKYGRLLVEIYLEDLHINQWLIDEKYANKYDGKTKTKW